MSPGGKLRFWLSTPTGVGKRAMEAALESLVPPEILALVCKCRREQRWSPQSLLVAPDTRPTRQCPLFCSSGSFAPGILLCVLPESSPAGLCFGIHTLLSSVACPAGVWAPGLRGACLLCRPLSLVVFSKEWALSLQDLPSEACVPRWVFLWVEHVNFHLSLSWVISPDGDSGLLAAGVLLPLPGTGSVPGSGHVSWVVTSDTCTAGLQNQIPTARALLPLWPEPLPPSVPLVLMTVSYLHPYTQLITNFLSHENRNKLKRETFGAFQIAMCFFFWFICSKK